MAKPELPADDTPHPEYQVPVYRVLSTVVLICVVATAWFNGNLAGAVFNVGCVLLLVGMTRREEARFTRDLAEIEATYRGRI
jgi:hypothetical protein